MGGREAGKLEIWRPPRHRPSVPGPLPLYLRETGKLEICCPPRALIRPAPESQVSRFPAAQGSGRWDGRLVGSVRLTPPASRATREAFLTRVRVSR